MEEVSDEEKLQIAQHYLLNAPPGQFEDVLKGAAPLRESRATTRSLSAASTTSVETAAIPNAPAGLT